MAEKKSCANCVNCDKLDTFWACEEYGFYHNGHTPVRCDPPYDEACELWTDDPSRRNTWERMV